MCSFPFTIRRPAEIIVIYHHPNNHQSMSMPTSMNESISDDTVKDDGNDVVGGMERIEDEEVPSQETVETSITSNMGKADVPLNDESSSTNDKKRAIDESVVDDKCEEDDEGPLPNLPLKRARTAYFVFADEKRRHVMQEVCVCVCSFDPAILFGYNHYSYTNLFVNVCVLTLNFSFFTNLPQHQGEGVAAIGKAIGELWKALTPSDKEPYEIQAAKEKMQYSRNKQRLIDAGKWQEKGLGDDGGTGEDGDHDALIFPLQRVRKICKLDPDVKGISKESALLITKAAELFTSKLGKECVIMAQMQNRRKLMTDDVVTVCSTKEAFMFLRADLQDVKDEQDAEAKLNKKDKERAAKEAGEMQSTATRNNLDSYFGRPTPVTDAVSEKVTS